MKRVIVSATNKKFYTSMLDEADLKDRLHIPVSEVKDQLLKNVYDDLDKEIIQYLIDNKIIPTIVTSHDMRNNPYYDLEDKFISLQSDNSDNRVYNIPYPGSGRFGEGNIFLQKLTIFDSGKIQFGNGKVRDPYSLAPSTLKSAFFRE